MTKEKFLARITEHYLSSADFNGLLVEEIGEDHEEVRQVARELLREGSIILNFGDRHPNPHILAIEPESQEEQLSKLDQIVFEPPIYEEFGMFKIRTNAVHCCAYPCKSHLQDVVDKAKYEGQPYTLMLALGEPQLSYRAFNSRVLEFYRNDPRYSFETDDIHGCIYVHSGSNVEPADDTFLETFGFAYGKDLKMRYVAAFLRYLSHFSPEHQQRWRLEQTDRETFLHPDYAKSSAGSWETQESMFSAFCEELRIISEMTEKIRGISLFRKGYGRGDKPTGFNFLIRPTKREYEAFVHLLDKMVSDNLNKKFFEGQVDVTIRETSDDGVVIERQKATITLLDEWLTKKVKFSDPTSKNLMISVFRRIRRERGPLAHEVQDDRWDDAYFPKQRDLMIEAYGAIRTLRLIFANHPYSKTVKVPDWLFKSEIRTY